MRLFCAVELSDEARARAREHIALMHDAEPKAGVRWERPDKLHITMKFFGEVVENQVADLTRAVERVTNGSNEFTATVEGTGTFPPRALPRIWWLGVRNETGELQKLYEQLENECAASGFAPDERRFHPHVIIGRTGRSPKEVAGLAHLHRTAEFAPVEFKVGELVIMRSELGAGGSRYTVLTRHELKTVATDK